MSEQIYKLSFGYSGPVVHTGALDVVIQAAKSIGNFAHALLMITIVGVHPVWVILLIAFVFSR